ncbi:MAG: HEAT repeat domain-containing protein [Candidatus Wallbacteria bacterium]|nr:HEAT repeat domain-containing protein [Candidatus Wallbacteria bacterium]
MTSDASRTAFDVFLQDILGLRREDYAKSAVFLAYLLLCGSICTVALTVRDTLFLSHFGVGLLPRMFIIYGFVSAVVAAAHGRWADRVSRPVLITVSSLGIAASYVVFWWAARRQQIWLYPALFVWAELSANLVLTQFRMYANDLHTSYEAKRVFGFIGSGMVLGFIVAGTGVRLSARLLGTENLLLVIAVMMLGVVGFVALIRMRFLPALEAGPRATQAKHSMPWERQLHGTIAERTSPFTGRYARVLGVMLLTGGVACTLVDFQFKTVAQATYRSDELAAYLGTLDALVGGFAFLLQTLLTGRILRHYGLVGALAFTPISLLGSSALLVAMPGILTASLVKFCDVAFRCSINDAAQQLLYFPFPESVKGRVRAILEGAVSPMAYAVGGILLCIVPASSSVRSLGWFTLPLLALWCVLVRDIGGEYVDALSRTLRDRRARKDQGLSSPDDGLTGQALAEMAGAADPDMALVALELLRKGSVETAAREAARLAGSPVAALRIRALEILEESPDPSALAAVEASLSREQPEAVRTAAAGAYAALRRDASQQLLVPMLGESEEGLRVAILAGLIRYGGLGGVLACGQEVYRLLQSASAAERMLGLQVLGRVGLPQFHPQIQPMLADPDPDVRRTAAWAAGQTRDPALLTQLAGCLREPRLRGVVAKALARFGGAVVSHLDAALQDPAASPEVAKGAVSVLREIGSTEALSVLSGHLDHPDERVRRKVLRAAARVHRELGRPLVLRPAELEERIASETRRAYQTLYEREVVLPRYPGELMKDLFAQDLLHSQDRVWSALSLAYDPSVMSRIRCTLQFGTTVQKANALEVLDASMPSSIREPILWLFEDRPPEDIVQRAQRHYSFAPVTPDSWLVHCAESQDGWGRVVSLDAIGVHRVLAMEAHARRALQDREPVVRETAAWTLGRLLGAGALAELGRMRSDTDERVRATADLVAARLRNGGPVGEAGCYSLHRLELALFMRGVDLFGDLGYEELASLVECSRQLAVGTDESIVREGDPGDSLYLLLRGSVEVLVGGNPVGRLGPKQSFGEMALLDSETRSATVRTLEPCQLVSLEQEAFSQFLQQRPEASANVLRSLTHRIRSLGRKLATAGVSGVAGGVSGLGSA